MKTYIKDGKTLRANYSVTYGDKISESGDPKLKFSNHVIVSKANICFNGVSYDNEFAVRCSISHKTGRYSITYIHVKTGFKCGDSHKQVINYLVKTGVIN